MRTLIQLHNANCSQCLNAIQDVYLLDGITIA